MTCFRCEELERVLGLREQFPPHLGLSNTMRQITGMLLKREMCSTEAIFTAVWGARPEVKQPNTTIVGVYICKIRDKLRPHGIEISTQWGTGFFLTSENKQRLRDLCAQREAA